MYTLMVPPQEQVQKSFHFHQKLHHQIVHFKAVKTSQIMCKVLICL